MSDDHDQRIHTYKVHQMARPSTKTPCSRSVLASLGDVASSSKNTAYKIPQRRNLEAKPQNSTARENVRRPQNSASAEAGGEHHNMEFGKDILMPGLSMDCFTNKRTRIVVGFDGIKACPVILMPFDLSTKIQEMILWSRRVSKKERESEEKLEALRELQWEINREINLHEIQMLQIQERIDDEIVIDVGQAINFIEKLRQESTYLDMLAEEIKIREEVIKSTVVAQRAYLQENYAAVAEHLEEAFINAEAVEQASKKDDISAPVLCLQEEYQELMRSRHARYEDSLVDVPLETGDAFMYARVPSPTPKQQVLLDARKALKRAHTKLERVTTEFERKEEDQDFERHQNSEARSKGEFVTETALELDLRWVVQNREITRQLREAEEAVAQARLVARDVGISVQKSQPSCFPDDDSDGTPKYASGEDPQDTVAVSPRIITWLEGLGEYIDPDFIEAVQVEEDDWDTKGEVGIGDSSTSFAEGVWRRRIDKWQQSISRRASIA